MLEDQAQWFAVFTKPRQEQIALEHLERQGFECFLPMAINPYQRRSQQKQLRIEALFPRYLFLRAIAGQQSLGPVRSTRGVCSLVRFGMQLMTVPEKVIRSIRARMQPESGLIRLDPAPVEPGDKVRVFDGPFAGFEGILKEKNGTHRAVLLMKLLGREATVEVDTLLLQRTG